ncbi:MAG: radical SAM protein [Desulforegulaceae bacterium]|nr:radical SAM protein [Desulforegulaceae bacterium]
MKLLIINPPIRVTDKPRHIPHGLAILANIIRKKLNFVDLVFIDWNANRYSNKKMKSILREVEYDVVMIGGLVPVYKTVIELSQWIRSISKKAKIIAGGSVAMSIPQLLLENSEVDIVCTGEGEKTIVNLLRALKEEKNPDLNKIKGLAYLEDDNYIRTEEEELIKDLDLESDMPAYDLLPMDIYLKNNIIGLGRETDFISSRGCPYKCSFCYQPWGRKFRGHSVEFITDSIKYIDKLYGLDFVCFQDDEFMAKPKRVYEFCEARNKYFPNIRWSSTGRANIINDDIMQVVTTSGCCSVSYGFESGSPFMLKKMNKAITPEQMSNAVYLNRKYGLPIPISFILGMPGETRETCEETIHFCIENNLHLGSLMFATPYPGTEIFEYALSKKRINENKLHEFVLGLGDARDFVINLTDEFTDEELKLQYGEMQKRTLEKFTPLPIEEVSTKIKTLYGKFASDYLNLDDAEKEHRQKHGAINLF